MKRLVVVAIPPPQIGRTVRKRLTLGSSFEFRVWGPGLIGKGSKFSDFTIYSFAARVSVSLSVSLRLSLCLCLSVPLALSLYIYIHLCACK